MRRSSFSPREKGLGSFSRFFFVFTAVLLISAICWSSKAYSAQVTLAWDSSSGPVAGYKIYYGNASRSYTSSTDAGNQTTYVVTNLQEGSTYYFAATAYDSSGNQSDYSDEVSYQVPSSNHAPVAQAGTLTVVQGASAAGNLVATDADGNPLTYSIVGQPSKGSVTVNNASTGAYTYTANASATGTDTFTFKANDGTVDSNTATVTVTISSVNHAPVASNGTLTTQEDAAKSGTLSATDVDGNSLTYSIVGQPSKGTVAVTNASTGAYTYTPAANVNGTDSFTFRASDGALNSNTATVTVTISPVNDAPVASNGTLTTQEDTAKSGTLSATDVDGNSLTYSIVGQPSKGSVAITNASTGAYTYTPAANANGTDSFTFRANDGTVNSNTATVTVTITQVNDAPVASDGSLTTQEDTAKSGTLSATDVDGNSLTYSIVGQPSKGTVAITNASTGAYTYTPAANVNGTDSFTFRANDGTVNSNTATVTVTITPVNDAPVASNGSLTTQEDTANSGTLSATDVDGNSLTYSIVGQPSKGSVAVTNATTGAYTYTPAANANGTDSFTFRANDGTVNSNTATVTVTITPVNDAPVASNGTLTTQEDTAKSGTLSATDVDGDSLTYSIVGQPSKGAVTIVNASIGSYTYAPNAGASGADTFTFRANDGSAVSNTATITVTITAVNHAPVASNGTITTQEDSAASGNLVATDADNDALTYSIVAAAGKGTVTITSASTGAYTYTPNANVNGTDTFTFKVSDGTVASNTATVAVTIIPVNDVPVASNGTLTTQQDTAGSGQLVATDVDGDTLTYSIVSQPTKGTVAITNSTTGAYTYTPNASANGTDTFTFKASDGSAASNQATVTVTITAVNHAPVASNGTLTTQEDTAGSGNLVASDADSDSLTYNIVSQPSKGTVAITSASTGAYTYTPKADANGTDTFTFKASDGTMASNTATVAVTITPVNDAPVAVNDTAETTAGTPVTVDVLANDTDVDGDTLTVTSVTQGTNGTVTLLGGKVTYSPKSGTSGQDTFTYTVGDGNGGTANGKVTVSVGSGNQPPVASNGNLAVLKNNAETATLPASDPDGDALTYKVVSAPKKGVLKITNATTGAFTYTPNRNTTGSDSFSFKVNDGQVDSNVANVSVTIYRRVRIWLEAESGSLSQAVQVAADSQASGGEYAYVPKDDQVMWQAKPPKGYAEYTFQVPVSTNYMIYDRVRSDDFEQKALSVSVDNGEFVSWNVTRGAVKAWVWDKVTKGASSEPSSYFLEAGEHTLVVKQQNDGTKIDKILITTESDYLQEKTYEDAEDGTTVGWDVVDANPVDARIVNVLDQDRRNNVIKLKGDGLRNRYELLSKKYTEWQNTKQHVVEWNLKFGESYKVFIDVETTKGPRTLLYQPLNRDGLGTGRVVQLGVGSATRDGQWHRFVRDLQADLQEAQPGVKIKKVNSFSIRGSGRVDDIKLRSVF